MNRVNFTRSLADTYSKKELRHIAQFLKEAARAEPNTRKKHIFCNGLRARVEFDDARNEFRTHLAAALEFASNADTAAWLAALDAVAPERTLPADFTSGGVIFYAPGYKWNANAVAAPAQPRVVEPTPTKAKPRAPRAIEQQTIFACEPADIAA